MKGWLLAELPGLYGWAKECRTNHGAGQFGSTTRRAGASLPNTFDSAGSSPACPISLASEVINVDLSDIVRVRTTGRTTSRCANWPSTSTRYMGRHSPLEVARGEVFELEALPNFATEEYRRRTTFALSGAALKFT